MTQRLLLALIAGASDAAASHQELYVTVCEGQGCNGPVGMKEVGTSAAWGAGHKHSVGSPDSGVALYLAKFTYSGDHETPKREILSGVQGGMGYIDVDPKAGKVLFATQGAVNVDTYVLDISNSSGAAAPPTPQVLIGDRTALLAPCKNTTDPSAPGGCVSVNTFFARWPRTSTDEVIFAFVAWTQQGDLAMAQGLAAVKPDGTGARILTHDPSVCPYATCDGTKPPEKGFSDRCPLAMPDGKVVFTRSFNQDLKTQIAILDLATGNVTVPDQLPHVATKSGCPSADATGTNFIYMACSPVDAYGSCAGNATFTYGSVDVSKPSVFVPTFAAPLIDSPDWEDTYSTTQCWYDRPAHKSISCLGASKKADTVFKHGVNQKTGHPAAVDIPEGILCMTPECFQSYVVDDRADDMIV